MSLDREHCITCGDVALTATVFNSAVPSEPATQIRSSGARVSFSTIEAMMRTS